MESKYWCESLDIDGRNELFRARSPNLLHVSLRESGRDVEMQSKLGAGVLVYFYFHRANPLKLAFFRMSRGPLADLINITEKYFPLFSEARLQYIASELQTDGVS